MQITKHQHQHLLLLFLFCLVQISYSSNTSSYYYDQCSPSTCGASLLQFPFGRNSLCQSAYITTHCENNTVYITDDENPYIKYKLLQNLTKEVYAKTRIRLVDVSLFGCGQIPAFSGPSDSAGYEAQKWVMLGVFHKTSDYRTGTFFNCTGEPDAGTLPTLIKAPCLECGETNNSCYFYDGYIDHIPNCIPFRVPIPVEVLSNFSAVGNLRKVLEEGFEMDWDGICNPCMEMTNGRCGYLNEERKSGEEACFCGDGVHRNNCSDGLLIELDGSVKGHGSSNRTRQVAISLGIGLGAGLLFLCMGYIYFKRRRRHPKSDFNGEEEQALRRYLEGDNTTPASIETFLHNYTLGRPTRFSYKQLKKYTNGFTHKLGQGGYGSVFKGELPNGFCIAVKVLDETEQSEVQFLNEVRTIGQIHHNHLVRLLGYCFEQKKQVLVYEFMVNGSLDKYIHKKDKNLLEKLSWNQLHDIAVGTAKGLAYLHEECRIRILHCDIKPHNILLDDEFRPKVSDFGLALALNREKSHVSLTHGTGTPGYAPPEMWWLNCGPVTEKSDVYSFGMVLLEMAGKRRNFDVAVSNSSEMYFPEWVYSHHVANVNGSSNGDSGGGGSKWHPCHGKEEEETARRMELVGLWCIQFEPSQRPSMRRVIEMLEGNVVIEIPPAPMNPGTFSTFEGKSGLSQLGSFKFNGIPETSKNSSSSCLQDSDTPLTC